MHRSAVVVPQKSTSVREREKERNRNVEMIEYNGFESIVIIMVQRNKNERLRSEKANCEEMGEMNPRERNGKDKKELAPVDPKP